MKFQICGGPAGYAPVPRFMKLFEHSVAPDCEALLRCLVEHKQPARVHHLELFLDEEIKAAVARRFELDTGHDSGDPHSMLKRDVALHRFLGYDAIRINVPGLDFPLSWHRTDDATNLAGQIRGNRDWVEEHTGPLQTWEDFERFPWPDIRNLDLSRIEWFDKNLPDDMTVYELTAHVFEVLSWGIGYENLCYKVYDDWDFVQAVADRVGSIYVELTRILCQSRCIGIIWASDDMGFKTQPLLAPEHLRRLVLPWHKQCATLAHEYNKPYFLHACGNLELIMDDLIDDVGIQARHSFEDAIMPVVEAKKLYGKRVGLIGGMDMDFLCRAAPEDVRRRVRDTLDICQPEGGYCLGSGNTIANYIPLDNYLAMLDEGRKYS
ncbi:MAG TPA: uroporphyrinogen decarboxylase family protein [Candidatus Sumerlaeota bacterium]|nr:uroporphyrinogen decarboxylase family protein [Candidatus Sumerlaeota bacterium]